MYNHIVLGGTFDHLHIGHKDMLSHAFMQAERVSIGLTTEVMASKKSFPNQILPYALRQKEIEQFCISLNRQKDVNIIPIEDVYGTADTDKDFDAILVTEHTKLGAEQINNKRKENGLAKLPVLISPLLKDASGEVISSSRIREGLIARDGFIYRTLLASDIYLTSAMREVLSKPLGKIFPDHRGLSSVEGELVLVGDAITASCVRDAVSFSFAYIDGFTHKQAFSFAPSFDYRVEEVGKSNPPGTISGWLYDQFPTFPYQRNDVYKIMGEEDLITAAAILCVPLGTIVAYGNRYSQPGIVVVEVTEERKDFLKRLFFKA